MIKHLVALCVLALTGCVESTEGGGGPGGPADDFGGGPPLTEDDIARGAGVVRININGAISDASCLGTLMNPGNRVVTAWHCVERYSARNLTILSVEDDGGTTIRTTGEPRHIADSDIAVIPVEVPSLTLLTPAQLGRNRDVTIYTTAAESNIRSRGYTLWRTDFANIFFSEDNVVPGQSGSPVVQDGHFVGVLTQDLFDHEPGPDEPRSGSFGYRVDYYYGDF